MNCVITSLLDTRLCSARQVAFFKGRPPSTRPARQGLQTRCHNWLDGVSVQGEIDIIGGAEEGAKEQRAAMASARDMSPNSKFKAILNQSEVDPRMSVDDITILSDTDKVGPPPRVHQTIMRRYHLRQGQRRMP